MEKRSSEADRKSGFGPWRPSGAKLPLVSDYMARFVDALRPEMDIYDAVDFLLERRVTGAPVIDEERRVVGVLGEKDCLRLFAKGSGAKPPHGNVRDFMSAKFQHVTPDMDIYYAAGLLLQEEERRLPVLDAQDHLVGELTRFDVLRAIKRGLR